MNYPVPCCPDNLLKVKASRLIYILAQFLIYFDNRFYFAGKILIHSGHDVLDFSVDGQADRYTRNCSIDRENNMVPVDDILINIKIVIVVRIVVLEYKSNL